MGGVSTARQLLRMATKAKRRSRKGRRSIERAAAEAATFGKDALAEAVRQFKKASRNWDRAAKSLMKEASISRTAIVPSQNTGTATRNS
jgi:hypothetical protein